MNIELHKKSKKRKNLNDIEEVTPEKSKKKKKFKPVHEEDVRLIEPLIEEQNAPVIIEEDHDEWSKEDYLELIRRMELQLPKNDTKSFSNRVEKLDWDQVQFGSHSVDECYEKWKIIRSKVRHYRLLTEVLQDAKAWAETPWAAPLNKKKARHPEQPARPLSSFMLFYMDKKNKIMRRHPELKLTDISRIIGEKYKALSEEKKAYYLDKAKHMQEEYKLNLSKFYEKYPELVRVTKKQSMKNNKPLPPLKLYLREKLQKHKQDDDFNQTELVEKYKELWKGMSLKKKACWIRLAKEEEEKFLEQVHPDMFHEGGMPTKYKSVISKDENAILDRLAGKPEKPPNSAYSLFSRLMLQDKDHVDGEPKNRMKEIAKLWKDVPDDQKKAYAEKVQHMHETYKLEFANYLEGLPEEKKAEELAKLKPKKNPAKQKPKAMKKEVSVSSKIAQPDLFKNEPEKPPVTAWDLFKNEFFKKNSHLPSKVAYNQAAAKWKDFSRKEVEKYKKKHEHLKTKYMEDFAAFLKTLGEEELKEYSALKHARSTEEHLNEDTYEEESSSEEEDNSSSSNSSQESDSGVSEEEEEAF